MAANSSIEWTDATFNPWIGCAKVSPGCKNCYAETLDRRQLWDDKTHWGPAAPRRKTSASNWQQPLAWDRRAARTGQRYKVFCASLADVFERNDQLNDWRWDLMDLIAATSNLDWLLLTKRLENVLNMTPWQWHRSEWKDRYPGYTGWPANVWIGASVEDQRRADERVPQLLNIPARVRFLSLEPLLGPVDLSRWLNTKSPIHWVIVGGESGLAARPMHPDWARSIRDQCQAAETPFFFKQWGAFTPIQFDKRADGDILISPTRGIVGALPDPSEDLIEFKRTVAMRRIGKKAAGRLLDGREWSQSPADLKLDPTAPRVVQS